MMNHYECLQVTQTASDAVIRAAYKTLAQRWHPDRNQSNQAEAEAQMTRINEAYAVLSDPVKRANYDAELWPNTKATQPPEPPTPTEATETASPVSKSRHSFGALFVLWWLATFCAWQIFSLFISGLTSTLIGVAIGTLVSRGSVKLWATSQLSGRAGILIGWALFASVSVFSSGLRNDLTKEKVAKTASPPSAIPTPTQAVMSPASTPPPVDPNAAILADWNNLTAVWLKENSDFAADPARIEALRQAITDTDTASEGALSNQELLSRATRLAFERTNWSRAASTTPTTAITSAPARATKKPAPIETTPEPELAAITAVQATQKQDNCASKRLAQRRWDYHTNTQIWVDQFGNPVHCVE